MPVLVTADVPGQTQQGYDGILGALDRLLRQSPGFVLHSSYPIEGGWRVIEVWESTEAAAQFFAKYVHPNLPPGIKPKRVIQELHSLVRP